MICTFYSYKGGVGRTLALANLAELFYYAGLRVLVVDWDLMSPGLENYFPSLDIQKTRNHPGLIDMLLQFKEYMRQDPKENAPFVLESPSRYFIPVYNNDFSPGSLHLLTAGRRPFDHTSEYTRSMLTFDWQEFYDLWEGELYLNWLREQFEQSADIILIDCRAGISAMGGVCTYHLADVILMFCAPDQQNLQGTYEMAQKFTAEKVRQVRVTRPLKIMIVPTRIDEELPIAELIRIKYEFFSRFNAQNFSADRGLIAFGDAMWSLRIPQILSYSVRNTLLVRLPSKERHEGAYQAYCLLGETLAQQAYENSRIREFIRGNILQNDMFAGGKNDQIPVNARIYQDRFSLHMLVKTCCEVNLRPTPGYINKSPNEVIRIKQNLPAKILNGPQKVDDLIWWFVMCRIEFEEIIGYRVRWPQKNLLQPLSVHSPKPFSVIAEVTNKESQIVCGWVAEKTPNNINQLQGVDVDSLDQDMIFLVDAPYIEVTSAEWSSGSVSNMANEQEWKYEGKYIEIK